MEILGAVSCFEPLAVERDIDFSLRKHEING
jgi:hypothetical protein